MHPNGKIVMITGASAGIGAATARAFAHAGARLILAARNADQLQVLAHTLPGKPLVIPTDMGDPAAIQQLVAQTTTAFGTIDIIVQNAGVGLAAPVADIDPAALQQILAVNLLGPIALTRAALPYLRHGGGQIIFISSVVGLRALPYLGGYAATKAGLDRITEALRVELRGKGVAVTLVRPGTTRTDFTEHRIGPGRERRQMQVRAVTPEQVAQAIVWAAIREPRVAYVSVWDRLAMMASLLTPRLTDWLLARSFSWEQNSSE